MADRRVRLLARAALIIIVAVAFVVGTRAVLASNRQFGDVVLASGAVESLRLVGDSAVVTGTSTDYANSLEDNWAAIDLFVRSESRKALPEEASHVERSWAAFLVADQLWRMYDDGDTTPLVSDVYSAGDLLKSQPALATVVVGEGASARFDNEDMKAVKALFAAARLEQQSAAVLVSNALAELR